MFTRLSSVILLSLTISSFERAKSIIPDVAQALIREQVNNKEVGATRTSQKCANAQTDFTSRFTRKAKTFSYLQGDNGYDQLTISSYLNPATCVSDHGAYQLTYA
jgi:hypothetical protein